MSEQKMQTTLDYTKQDLLGFSKYIISFKDFITSSETPLSIGIYGSWGTGKTTFLKFLEQEFDSTDYITVWHDTTFYKDYKFPHIALIKSLLIKLNDDKGIKKYLKYFNELLYLGGIFSIDTIGSFVNLPNSRDRDDIIKSRNSDLLTFVENAEKISDLLSFVEKSETLKSNIEKIVEEITEEHEKKILFFIDDLDRCSSDVIIQFFESIKYYLDLKHCIFIFSLDKERTNRNLSNNLNIGEDIENEYLSKYINFPFFLPTPSDSTFLFFLNNTLPKVFLDNIKGLTKEISLCLDKNPRHAIRLSHIFKFNLILIKHLNLCEYNINSLFLSSLIQYKYPEFHKFLSLNQDKLDKLLDYDELLKSENNIFPNDGIINKLLSNYPKDDLSDIRFFLNLNEKIEHEYK